LNASGKVNPGEHTSDIFPEGDNSMLSLLTVVHTGEQSHEVGLQVRFLS
jgi:hypothetical protein